MFLMFGRRHGFPREIWGSRVSVPAERTNLFAGFGEAEICAEPQAKQYSVPSTQCAEIGAARQGLAGVGEAVCQTENWVLSTLYFGLMRPPQPGPGRPFGPPSPAPPRAPRPD